MFATHYNNLYQAVNNNLRCVARKPSGVLSFRRGSRVEGSMWRVEGEGSMSGVTNFPNLKKKKKNGNKNKEKRNKKKFKKNLSVSKVGVARGH